jgi:hypothetical protein
MTISNLGRTVIYGCIAVAMLCACGQQPGQIGTPAAIPTTAAFAAVHPAIGQSWVLPEAKTEDLLYTSVGSAVNVYSYKTQKLVGRLAGFTESEGLCVGKSGDVFVVDYGTFEISEFLHGGTKAIETLKSPGSSFSCAVDPTTGDLAVTNGGILGAGNLAIWKHAHGKPMIYSDGSALRDFFYCSYDDKGNLFVDGTTAASNFTGVFAELPKDKRSFINFSLETGPSDMPGGIFWDGRLVTMAYVYSGSTVTRLKVEKNHWEQIGNDISLEDAVMMEYWIVPAHGSRRRVLIAPGGNNDTMVGYWDYPRGGKPIATIPGGAVGVAVSMAK